MPPQYLEQPVLVPLQTFQEIWGLTKWVPPQYLTPSYGPEFASIFSICAHDLFLDENSLLLYTMQLTFKVMQIILSQFNR